MPRRTKRILLAVLLVCLQGIYFPINSLVGPGTILKIGLDDFIPLWTVWAVPYVLWQLWWIGCFLWAAVAMPERLFKRFFVTALVTILIGLGTFFFFPTSVLRPALSGNDIFSELLKIVYRQDAPNNAFPSAHIYITTLLTLFWSEWKGGQRWLWYSIFMIVALSTLLTRQHYIVDLLGGAMLGLLVYEAILLISEKNIYRSIFGVKRSSGELSK